MWNATLSRMTAQQDQERVLVQQMNAPHNREAVRSSSGDKSMPVISVSTETVLVNSSRPASTRPFCSREQVQSGSWVEEWMSKPPYVSHNKHLRCFSEEGEEICKNYTKPFRAWKWQPDDARSFSPQPCEWTSWNATKFCEKMQYATLSIIGDSLSWEHYSSLLQLLGEHVHQMDQHRSKSEKRNHMQNACGRGNPTSLIFRNDPYLKHVNESIRDNFPVILVVNRGAHYVSDEALVHDLRTITFPHLHQWQQICHRMNITCQLVWRTTVPGHVQCQNFTQPVNDMANMEQHVANLTLYSPLQITYNWHHFQRQNLLVLDELDRSGLHYHVLDAYHLNIRRPDGHRSRDGDCLHSCYPGKMDVYSTVLLHLLRIHRSEKDVQRFQTLFSNYVDQKTAQNTSTFIG